MPTHRMTELQKRSQVPEANRHHQDPAVTCFRKLGLFWVLSQERKLGSTCYVSSYGGCSGPPLPGLGTWHSCSLNSERSRRTICQSAGGREAISIHCAQLCIWKSTSNVPIHVALLHFSTFMSVIAFIFLVKTAKQVII